MPRRANSTEFWLKVDAGSYVADGREPPGNCHWRWNGSTDAKGRPLVWRDGRLWRAYRYAWYLCFGEDLPSDVELRRLKDRCPYADCVYPEHYEKFTRAPMRPIFKRTSKAAREFRATLGDAVLQAFRTGVDWYCTQGHTLKAGVERKHCPECQKERRVAKRSRLQTERALERAERQLARAKKDVARDLPSLAIPPQPQTARLPYHFPSLDGLMCDS